MVLPIKDDITCFKRIIRTYSFTLKLPSTQAGLMAGSVVTGDLGFFPRAHVGKLTACYSSSSWGFGGLFWPLRAPAFMCHTQHTHKQE